MTTPRILITTDAVGGVWTYALELARALLPCGFTPVLAVIGPALSAEQAKAATGLELIETGLPLDWMAAGEGEVRATARSIAALAAARNVNLIQLNQPAFAAEPMSAPVLAVAHSCVATWWDAVEGTPLPPSFAWQARLMREGLIDADRIACPSASFAAAVRATYRLPRLPEVVHNGRTPIVTAAKPLEELALTAGRLWDRGKDAATLDRAAARIDVPIRAAGATAGPHGETIALKHLHTLGSIDTSALAGELASRPVFVSAALYEPFGLSVLEAAQAGCALVLSDIPTFRELWEEVATFVAPGDDAGFADAVETLAGDPVQRDVWGALARRQAARFTPAAMAGGMTEIYRDVLGTPQRGQAAA